MTVRSRLPAVQVGSPAHTPASPRSQIEKQRRGSLLTWNEIPSWYQDNEYILSSYRPVSNSYAQSFRSILSLHNETANIFSHLIGSALFFTLPIPVYYSLQQPKYTTATTADVIVFSTFFLGVGICFALSATFHITSNHSKTVHIFGNQLDYLGIVILMYGSTIPSVYYGFYCTPQLQTTYYTLASVLAGACIYATLHPAFRRPQYRPYRAAMYAGLGLSFVVPAVHGLLEFGVETQMGRMSLDWMVVMAVINLTGGVVYALRIPEKWYPYRFDIWGSSHQIMHCLVVCAGIAHLCGLLRAFDHVHGHGDVCAV